MTFASINPATGETLQTFDMLSADELEAKIHHAAATFRSFRRTTIAERAAIMQRLAALFVAEKERLGRIQTLEMGKPVAAAVAETEKCALACRYYAERAEALLADVPVPTEAARSLVRYQPLGPLLAIMPWNFPYWQTIRFAAPALIAGNVVLLKHAPSVPQCALALEDLFRRAGLPDGAFQNLFVDTDAAAQVIADPRVAGVTLTGSTRAGSAVARAAGQAIKKVVLELGGSDPFIVTAHADVERAAQVAVQARTLNSGQSCIAAKRFIVADAVADAFTERFVARMAALNVGDPFDPATAIGPLATPAIRDGLADQVQRTVAAGARVLTGGAAIDGPGNFFQPTVLTDFSADSPARTEEFFGPVALLFRVRDLDEAIALANNSPYGLGASVWTRDEAEQARLIDELETGAVFVNSMVASDPRLPFGGVKNSGFGRELGTFGMHEFVNIKTVSVQP